MRLHSKQTIAADRGVTCRTVDNWRERGLLPAPIKMGITLQSRVRWTDESLATLDRNLASLANVQPAPVAASTPTANRARAVAPPRRRRKRAA